MDNLTPSQPDSEQDSHLSNMDESINAEFTVARNIILAMKKELAKVIVGQDDVIDQTLLCFIAAGHALVEGVPGLGKTLLVRSLAQAVSGKFNRIQFTPDLMPSDVSGHAMFNKQSENFVIRRGPVFCNLLLADEINRAPAKTQSALLEAMQENQVTVEGQSLSLPTPFMVMATQNPLEHEGTYPLPEAQLDRFLMHIWVDYPSEDEEIALSKRLSGHVGDTLDVSQINPVIDLEKVSKLQSLLAQMEIDEAIHNYAVRVVRATRDWHGIQVGAGPRGSLSVLRVAKAYALMQGRSFVIPDDIKVMAVPVLRHRIRLTAELEIEGISPAQVIEELLQTVEAPRL